MKLSPYSKAITAGITALIGGLQLAYVDQHFVTQELITIGIATAAAAWGTYAVPNTSPELTPVALQGEGTVTVDETGESTTVSFTGAGTTDYLEDH